MQTSVTVFNKINFNLLKAIEFKTSAGKSEFVFQFKGPITLADNVH